MGTEKKVKATYPPIPLVDAASTYKTLLAMGNAFKMHLNRNPRFLCSRSNQMRKAIRTIADRTITFFGVLGVICREIKDSNSFPKSSTHAAHSRLPTVRSRSFEVARASVRSRWRRVAYIITLAGRACRRLSVRNNEDRE